MKNNNLKKPSSNGIEYQVNATSRASNIECFESAKKKLKEIQAKKKVYKAASSLSW